MNINELQSMYGEFTGGMSAIIAIFAGSIVEGGSSLHSAHAHPWAKELVLSPFASMPRCILFKPLLLATLSSDMPRTIRHATNYGPQDEAVAHLVKDAFTKFKHVYP